MIGRIFPLLLTLGACDHGSDPNDAIVDQSSAVASIDVLPNVRARAGSVRTVTMTANSDLPTAEAVHGLTGISSTNAALLLTVVPDRSDGELRQTLYLRIFDDHQTPPQYVVYPIAEDVDAWEVVERSADRLVLATHAWMPDASIGNRRTFIITFGGATSHGYHGFYPAPESIEVAEAETPLNLVNPASGR